MNKFELKLKMHKPIESFVNAYTYWSRKYADSGHVNDLYKKTISFKQLMEEANKQCIPKHHLELLIEQSQKIIASPKSK